MYTIVPANRHHNRPTPAFDPFFGPMANFAENFMRPFFDMNHPAPQTFRVDVKETPEQWDLSVELPGVKPEDISLKAENDVLTVSADVNSERSEDRHHYVYTERRTGHMSRSFSLEGVDQEKINAAYENGVLTVTLPKLAPAAPKGAKTIAIAGVPEKKEPAEGAEDDAAEEEPKDIEEA